MILLVVVFGFFLAGYDAAPAGSPCFVLYGSKKVEKEKK